MFVSATILVNKVEYIMNITNNSYNYKKNHVVITSGHSITKVTNSNKMVLRLDLTTHYLLQ